VQSFAEWLLVSFPYQPGSLGFVSAACSWHPVQHSHITRFIPHHSTQHPRHTPSVISMTLVSLHEQLLWGGDLCLLPGPVSCALQGKKQGGSLWVVRCRHFQQD
jgi:hypothetical protein